MRPVWDPMLHIKVFDKGLIGLQATYIGETSIQLAPYLPWVDDPEEAYLAVEGQEDYHGVGMHIDTPFLLATSKENGVALCVCDCVC